MKLHKTNFAKLVANFFSFVKSHKTNLQKNTKIKKLIKIKYCVYFTDFMYKSTQN